jgi:methionyl-tRNA formyltransferase
MGGHHVMHTDERIDIDFFEDYHPDLLVSFGYRHIVRQPVLDAFEGRVVNLHISLLPWNRGADPNFWSWFDSTPKGVTMHLMDSGLDTGAILVQRELDMSASETLSSSYEILQSAIEDLFGENLDALLSGELTPQAQTPDSGSFHRSIDKEPIFARLPESWNTRCQVIAELGRIDRQRG